MNPKEGDHMKHKITFILLLGVILILSNSAFLLCQKEESGQELKHEVVVALKLIQVYVTDKDGKPVTDLKKEDFELYDNRKKQEITDFEKYVLTKSSLKRDADKKDVIPTEERGRK